MDKINNAPTAVTTAISAIKGFAKYLIIPSGVIMFSPDNWLSQFRLLEIKNQYGQWVAILFWISASIVIVDIVQQILKKTIAAYNQKKYVKSLEMSLSNLNDKEWEIIYLLYKNDSYSFDFSDASVSKLTTQKIITRPNTGTIFGFSYTLQPWVRTYLKKHPEKISSFEKTH